MGIGITLKTKCRNISSFQKSLDIVAEMHNITSYHEEDYSELAICRMGNISFHFHKRKKSIMSGSISVEGYCQTNIVGAGFHNAAIEIIEDLSRNSGLSFEIEDDTEYYTNRDFDRMRKEHFYKYLNALINVCKESIGSNDELFAICWDSNKYTPEKISGTLTSPFGRFDLKSLVSRIEKEGIEPLAEDFFMWNNKEQDALFYRNTALNALWEDCYFMPSERSEEDEKINTFIITNLEKAAILDTSLPFPKEDYLYICQLHNTQPIDISTLPELSGKYPIGYRKGVITYKIGNLSFDLPGKNLYTLDGNTCVFYDNDRENWHVTRATAYSQPDHYFEFVKSDDEFICEADFENGKYKLYFGGQNKEEDDDVYYTCLCQAITEDQYSIFTISAVTEVEAKSYIQTLADSLMAYRKR